MEEKRIRVSKITYDKGYEDKEPIVLSGKDLFVEKNPKMPAEDVVWVLAESGNFQLFKTSYGFSREKTEFTDKGELDLAVLVQGIIDKQVSYYKNIQHNNGSILNYNLKDLPEFLLDYADIYAERVSQDTGKPTSFRKMLLKAYQKAMADLFTTLTTADEKETILAKVRYDVKEITEFFDEREAKKQEENEKLNELNSIFEEVLND